MSSNILFVQPEIDHEGNTYYVDYLISIDTKGFFNRVVSKSFATREEAETYKKKLESYLVKA